MDKESIKKATYSSSSSSVDSYIGSFISLTSKYEIRYEGVLFYLNPQDSTLALNNVRSYGTEGRKKDGPQIPPNDKFFEYILFRGSDIKDLQVKSSPPAPTEESIYNDPAIIQSHCTAASSGDSKSVSLRGDSLTEFGSYQEPPALITRSYPGIMSSHQPGTHVGPWDPSQMPQNTNMSSFSMPKYLQGYNEMSSRMPCAPQHSLPCVTMESPLTVENLPQIPAMGLSATIGLINSSIDVAPVPSLTNSNSVHSNITVALTPEQYSTFPNDIPSSFSVKASLPSHNAVMSANRTTKSSFHPSCQDMNTIEVLNAGTLGSVHVQSLPCSVPLVVNSTSGPFLKQLPTFLTPDQSFHLRSSAFSPTHRPYPNPKELGALSSASPSASSSIAIPAVQAPLLPLPLSVPQSRCAPQFMEEFDFVAMNEKFKKDEVWDYLGKSKERNKSKGIEDSTVGQSLGDKEGLPKVDSKPAYNKDEFFDTISCTSLAQFTDGKRPNTEPFGNFQQITHPDYGGYGAGRGVQRGPYNRGRGYKYSGQDRGGYTHI